MDKFDKNQRLLIMEANDAQILAATIWGEARGEQLLGQIAVGCVIRNRSLDHRWPNSIKRVCLQPYQFSCWLPKDPNSSKMIDLLHSNDNYIFGQCLWIADGIIHGGLQEDVSSGANHYFADSIMPPHWASPSKFVKKVGHHRFYKL